MSRRNLIFRWQDGLLSSTNPLFRKKSARLLRQAIVGIFCALPHQQRATWFGMKINLVSNQNQHTFGWNSLCFLPETKGVFAWKQHAFQVKTSWFPPQKKCLAKLHNCIASYDGSLRDKRFFQSLCFRTKNHNFCKNQLGFYYAEFDSIVFLSYNKLSGCKKICILTNIT